MLLSEEAIWLFYQINICANIITNMWKYNIVTFIGIKS